MAKQLKNPIGYSIQLDEEQKIVKDAIYSNQIIAINGRAGSGKTLVAAQTVLDLLFKREYRKVFVTRVNVETGRSMGYLPGTQDDKLSPYLQGFKDNTYKCYANTETKKNKLDEMYKDKVIDGLPIAYIRGLTIDEICVVEEVQNTTEHEIKAILTRLGKNGKIILTGDFDQCDVNLAQNGLHYLKSLSKAIPEIKYFTLNGQHRSDLVGKILDWDYSRRKTNNTDDESK